jgi:hypothetical protein
LVGKLDMQILKGCGARLVSLGLTLLCFVLAGCATGQRPDSRPHRAFDFRQDTFAYANELFWEYHFDPLTGELTTTRRQPPPHYAQHCFVVARSARQFFQHARFDPAQPIADEATYRCLVRRILSRNPRTESPESEKIVVPGYANLRDFSQCWESLLKEAGGGWWHSYVQRGHWRMILPFSRGHQAQMAETLLHEVQTNRAPVVHLVSFPKLTINHALLVFGAAETDREIRFKAYDPNDPQRPVLLTYLRSSRRFEFPANDYFAGGAVHVYEIYRGFCY